MSLLWPGFLLLLGLIPLSVVVYLWMLRRRHRAALRYSSLLLVREALPAQSTMRRHLPFALLLIGLSSLIVAVARPVSVVHVPYGQATIILALDVSRSMTADDIPPSRMEAAKAAALSFVQRQGSSGQIGIVAFASFAALVQPPTTDQEALERAIRGLTTSRGTAVGSGILESLDVISEIDPSVAPSSVSDFSGAAVTPVPRGSYAPAIIVLLTDGVSRQGPWPLDAAQQAVERGIRVYTIGFGTEEGGRFFGGNSQFGGGPPDGGGFRRGIDEETLQQIAEMTGGEYYAAESASELEEVFENLPATFATREERTEISVAFTALAALLVGTALLFALLWQPLP